ncbi:MAG: metal ABC transporter ATP-binding protein [Candidatus Methanospirareceae archaeon]
MSEEIVRLEDVWVRFDNVTVLESINLTVYEHDFLGIIGPNGGGKTTLLKVILGLIKPNRGKVSVFGCAPEYARRYVGYVPQYSPFDRTFPASVWDVVLMGRLGRTRIGRGYSEEDKRLARQALEMVEMFDFRKHPIGKLSGGQQQRVFIARALVAQPKLLLLDEPMASVDSAMQTELYELLEKLRQKMTIIMVSHDISAVSVYVNKIACLNRRLFYHNSKELTAEDIKAAYQCPVEMITHEISHRVLRGHE